MKQFKILGFNDEITICDVCGKSELKGTYALENNETGDIIRAGSSCGAKLASWGLKEFTKKAKLAEEEEKRLINKMINESEENKALDAYIEKMNKNSDDLEKLYYNAVRDKNQPEVEKIRKQIDELHKERMLGLRPLSNAKRKKIDEIKSLKQFKW